MHPIADKIMFEIYRETSYNRMYRVVYYTELNEQNKEYEINRAMAGEHLINGYILESTKEAAKDLIQNVIIELNSGANFSDMDVRTLLQPYLEE